VIVRVPAGPDELGVAEELPRVRGPEKGAERHPEDAVSVDQIGFGQRPDDHRRHVYHCSPYVPGVALRTGLRSAPGRRPSQAPLRRRSMAATRAFYGSTPGAIPRCPSVRETAGGGLTEAGSYKSNDQVSQAGNADPRSKIGSKIASYVGMT